MRRGLVAAVVIAVGLAACAGVLGLRRERVARFPHRAHVLAGVGCPQCHVGVATAGHDTPLHLPDDATCTAAGCHATPHDPHPCSGCHSDALAIGAVVEARDHLRFSHATHQVASVGNCVRCHVGVAQSDGPLRPAMATCWSCHEHDRVRDIRDCGACHVDLAEEGTAPASHLIHDDDFATRHGTQAAAAADLCATCHREEFCSRCHGTTMPTLPARLRPADPLAASVHRPAFLARHGEQARVAPAACTSCHAPSRCLACHQERGVIGGGTGSPHPPGWVGIGVGGNLHGPAARRDPVACASCHGGAGEALCVGCHRVGGPGGNPHPPGWSSPQPLGSLPCRLCHPLGARP
ncbi:MAG: cytochrome c3 family protein [Kofleriaceae bacterium]